MRVFAKIMETLGVVVLCFGMASMDDPTLIGIVMLFGGFAIAFGGVSIEEAL